ncbi:MAG: gamma-glutamyl-gamma-aminobutyrate hydrolase family protein [Bryobacteraceae bacterium]
MPKRVGLTCGSDHSKFAAYFSALDSVGLDPVFTSPAEPHSLDEMEGLVLCGGTDIDPALYGQERGPHTEEPDRGRDRLEKDLATQAIERDMPVLGICRGIQLLNALHGGTLHQHLEGHSVRGQDTVHRVRIAPGTKLACIMPAGPLEVNSRHHQAIDRVGLGLTVSAVSEDGQVIEGTERHDKRFVIGIQWHSEDLVGKQDHATRLFEAFADAVRAARRL